MTLLIIVMVLLVYLVMTVKLHAVTRDSANKDHDIIWRHNASQSMIMTFELHNHSPMHCVIPFAIGEMDDYLPVLSTKNTV